MANAIEMMTTDREGHPEARLWQAVLVSTIQEWISGPLRRQREAEKFLFNDNEDFRLVCASAGINPDFLRTRLAKIDKKAAISLELQAAA
jgi:hypothetical protein